LRNRGDVYLSNQEVYLLKGGGYSNWKLIVYYPLWISRLFFHFLRKKNLENSIIFVVNFDGALPIFLASFFRKRIKYIYDIHDEFALSYKFPLLIVKTISFLDTLIKSRAYKVIHVDKSRVSKNDRNYEIIFNSPADFYNGIYRNNRNERSLLYVVSGLLVKTRGLESIYKFALANPNFNFIVAGRLIDDTASKLVDLKNVDYFGMLPQYHLFERIKNADGIFSLYDPSIEINKLAASNKLYDAMMLGIPVIVNNGILAEHFVRSERIGYVVNYEYDETWGRIYNADFREIKLLGRNGRKIYETTFDYQSNYVHKLDRIFSGVKI